jgi:hypothetical protein
MHRSLALVPARPIAPPTAFARVEHFAAETLHEFAGMLGIGEAIDVEPLIVMENGMAAGTQR